MRSESFLPHMNHSSTVIYWENTSVALLGVGLVLFLLLGLSICKSPKGIHSWFSTREGEATSTWARKRGDKGEARGFKVQFPASRRQAIILSQDEKACDVQRLLKGPSSTQAQHHQLPSTKTPDFDKPGQYTPSGFSTEDLKALGTFPDYSVLSDLRTIRPCVALMKFEPDFWIELENYFNRLEQRKQLLKQYGTSVLDYSPGSELACRELMEMVLQFVCIRYPHYFALEESNTIFVNRLLKTRTELNSQHPLHILFDNIPEDFAMMLRNEEDGMYYLRSGFICSSIGWTFGTHHNRELRAIHTEVNDYAEKMSNSMDRFFSKMPVERPIQRGSWFVEDWEPLFVTPEEYEQNAGTRHQGESVGIEQCYLRCDWQTLRRLPLSGAIVFNFKAVFTPITELRDEPYIPSLLYKQITAGNPLLTEPKVHAHIRPVVLDALQAWKKKQVEKGMIPSDWVEETLAESPFYPGWEERWRKKIGFDI
ncbi:hypothetical protein CLAIMM_02988 [Cladophialophora immunda]|nr:hypothetical protein CLAIMM_02988 [Cladophialophora immunda]